MRRPSRPGGPRCRQMESKRTDAVAPAALNYLSAAIEAGQPYLWEGFSVPKLAVLAIANAALAASVALRLHKRPQNSR